GGAHRWITRAVNHLLDLHKELDLADTAASALEIITRPDDRTLRKMVANAGRNLVHVLDHTEVERAPPDERLDRVEEPLSDRRISRRGARPDECCALPRGGTRFVMRNGGIHREHDRRDFGRGSQPQVDTLDVSILGALLHDLDDPPADA